MSSAPSRLYHFSEEPDISEFVPRRLPGLDEAVVWAVDQAHAHIYLFPRDCPRVTFYAGESTTLEDRERFLGSAGAAHVIAIEASRLPAMRITKLYRYEYAPDGFELFDDNAGYWVSRNTVRPLSVEPVGDLLQALAEAGVEIRITPDLRPLYEAVIVSTMHYSIIRWRNAVAKDMPLP